MAKTPPCIVPFEKDGVTGFLHRPEAPGADGLVLTHGAGSDCRTPLLLEAAAAFGAAGLIVLRCDLPFRRHRASGPPSPSTASADRAGLRAAAVALRELAGGRLFVGGHSYGGRQATMLAADEPGVADALLLLSYPLHPPRKPEQRRTAHFPRLRTPAVFVHGTKDAFGSIEEMEAAVSLIPAPTRIISVAGAGHDLRRGRFDFAPAVTALLGPVA